MIGKKKQPYCLRMILFYYLSNHHKITKRFGHFFMVDIYKTVMDPYFGKRFSKSTFRRSDFVFMMRKTKVHSPP